jgi:hypothetical protein
MKIYDRSGNMSGTDPDGVKLSFTQTGPPWNTTYTDTLNTTVLTSLTNGGYNDASDTYTYLGGDGINHNVTVSYSTYTQKTVYGCTGITDLTGGGAYFPTTITTPEGNFSISYETTPGYSPDITGRIATITYPSGGSVTYAYSGGSNHGVNCNSKVVPTLSRTVNDNNGNSSTWTYVNTNDSGTSGNFTVTVDFPYAHCDSRNSTTVYNFAGGFQTEAAYYQGSATGYPAQNRNDVL